MWPFRTKIHGAAKTGTTILGEADEPAAAYLIAEKLREQVGNDVTRAGYAAPSSAHLQTLQERGEAQVSAAAPLPVDATFVADRSALERIEALKKDVEIERTEHQSSQGEARRAEDELNERERPWSWPVRFLVALFTLAATAVAIFAVGKLMAPSVDAYFVRSWAESLNLGDAAGGYAVREARQIAFAVAAGVILLSTVGTLAMRRARWWLKLLPLLAELLLSLSFAVIRLGGHITFSAMAVSGLEMAVLLGHLAGLMLVAAALDHDQTNRAPFTKAARKLKMLRARVDLAGARFADAELRVAEQIGALQRREDGVRALPSVKKLSDATTSAEYVAALSRVIEEKAAVRAEGRVPIRDPRPKSTNGSNGSHDTHKEE